MIEINWKPSPRELRSFGWVILVGFGLLGGLARWKGWETASLVLWALALVIWLVGLAAPRLLRPVYLGWMLLAWPIGWVVSHILLGLVFFLLFTLVALVFRIIGRDPLARSRRGDETTYWTRKQQPGPEHSSRYFRQF